MWTRATARANNAQHSVWKATVEGNSASRQCSALCLECDGLGRQSFCTLPKYPLHLDHQCIYCNGNEVPSDKIPRSEECPTTPKERPARGVLHGAESDRAKPTEERKLPRKPIGPAPKPFDFVEPEGQSARAMDLDDTAATNYDTAK